ncbi:response regulator transcription factor [Mycolicibacter sp. MYC123]|uniref:Response regulator transcription factor n=1 Tax=[Mycobacterium] zoologicum TaxID=2872311 RepID=A0ABU5YRF0_9MYCO|nr:MULTISPECIES: response regulator transcription factor [unclassified Mycolicibacter]MEB3052436.1 response regulator transcription factor [Mycolicibacter sp. MYC123]MEB3062213.1 response regulator transcription factor [Mycolicibacter sp. MYC101]
MAPQTDSGGATPPVISVAVVDGHDVVAAGIAAWCVQAESSISVVGSFHSPREMLARYPDVPNEIDVVVFDIFVDGDRPAFAALRAMCQAGQRVVVYSQLSTDEVILTCLDMGAVTYLVKTEGQRHLIDAIEAAHSAEPYVGPQMAKALANDRTSGRTNLSEREKEVLITWFQTESKELVGGRLYIAPTTVRTHLQRARAKYAAVGRPAPTKAALLARAIEDGILSLSDL